jgi:hypothetical protein
MGRIYTTKMVLRKALITVWLTIEPESGTPAPLSWLESQGEKYTPGLATPDSASGGRAFSAIGALGRF